MEAQVKQKIFLSIIIPVYNRADEVDSLLESFTKNDNLEEVEVIIVEDGSARPCEKVLDNYKEFLTLSYIFIENSGPSKARNIGATNAKGDYLIFLDSDVILPRTYIKNVIKLIKENNVDLFGGPDKAHDSFTDVQKAINYAMTSPLTTGGIRGGSKSKMEKFKPRSFNLGCKKTSFIKVGGFTESMRFGEDIDFSLRMIEKGFNVCLFKEAYVYHRRRIDLFKFFKQVYNSGLARIILGIKHKGSTRLVHRLPMIFVLLVPLSGFTIILPFLVLIFLHSYFITKNNFKISILAALASFIQIFGYGFGFIVGWINKDILNQEKHDAFVNTFYD